MIDTYLETNSGVSVEVLGGKELPYEVSVEMLGGLPSTEKAPVEILRNKPKRRVCVELLDEKTPDVCVEKLGEFIPVGEYKHYKGESVVTPKFEEQTLNTKNKVMDSDVNVKPISVVETPNPSGGITVIIGD